MGSLPCPGSCTGNATRVSSLALAELLCCPDLGLCRHCLGPRLSPAVGWLQEHPLNSLLWLRISSKSFSSILEPPGIHPPSAAFAAGANPDFIAKETEAQRGKELRLLLSPAHSHSAAFPAACPSRSVQAGEWKSRELHLEWCSSRMRMSQEMEVGDGAVQVIPSL